MEEKELQVRLLGNFSLQWGDKKIDDSSNRSKKVWLLLAYLIYSRQRVLTQGELTDLLWGEDASCSNPANALKTMLHRVRRQLEALDGLGGHQLVLRKENTYAWNTEVPLKVDVEEFDALCHRGMMSQNEEERLDCYLQAIALYRGDFLSRLSSEAWVVTVAAHYRNLYLQAAQESVTLLEAHHRRMDAAQLCRLALAVDPYHEGMYRHLLQNLFDLGRQEEVVGVYEEMNERFLTNLGVSPAEDIRAMYRQAVRVTNDRAISMDTVLEQLREAAPLPGALICEYDFFKVIYQALTRAIVRSGENVQLCLLSVSGKGERTLTRRGLDKAMDNLEEELRRNIRRGDVAARCSVSQYVLLLPQATWENGRAICDRVIQCYTRRFPHSPAQIIAVIHSLAPGR